MPKGRGLRRLYYSMSESSAISTIHHLKVSLDGVYPIIWRRLAVPSTATLADLHMILQIALGWEGYHLHEFHVLFDARFGMGNLVQGQAPRTKDEGATLQEIAGWEGARLRYVYDLGDYWEHTIVVEKIRRPASSTGYTDYPRCLAGARMAPPEDCGGPESYMAMLRRRQSQLTRRSQLSGLSGSSRQTRQLRKSTRTGTAQRTARSTSFDPTAFDRDEINRQLSSWWGTVTESATKSVEVNEPDNP